MHLCKPPFRSPDSAKICRRTPASHVEYPGRNENQRTKGTVMKILVLGGTVFLGRQVVEEALRRGHDLTLFHRGQHGRDLFPMVQRVLGDRGGDLSRLQGLSFDAVIDTSGYLPRLVQDSASFLSTHAGHYVFVSTISVYRDFDAGLVRESHPLATLPAGADAEEVSGDTYGPLKALCEQAVQEHFAGATTVVRPGLIVGPHDPTDRFTYWIARLAEGGVVAVPGPRTRPVQFIDVRDLAAFLVHLVETRQSGTFNATGPDAPLDMGTLVETVLEAAQQIAEVAWLPEDYLLSQGIGSWIEMPLWIPESPDSRGLFRISIDAARTRGLRLRAPKDTIAATLEWHRERGSAPLRAGLDPDRERALLAGWQEAHPS